MLHNVIQGWRCGFTALESRVHARWVAWEIAVGPNASQLFLGAQFCSVAADAGRAGSLNRQNIAAFTLSSVGTWGAPQVMCDIVPEIFSLVKSKSTL